MIIESDPSADDELEVDGSPQGDVDTRRLLVSLEQHGLRLDKVLATVAPEFSRSHHQGLIARGAVQVDGATVLTNAKKLRAAQWLEVALWPTAESSAFTPQPMALPVVHEDEHLLVLNKPAGLVVHPAPGHWSGTLLNGLLAHHPGAVRLPRAGIVHRLDKDTSGLMVVAKTSPAMQALSQAIAQREVHRHYWALAQGRWRAEGPVEVNAPVGRDPKVRVRMAVVASGKPALTTVTPLATGEQVVAVECKLHTGRTHQIRVHLSHLGLPLVADALYGGRPDRGLQRQALHAKRLAFTHPVSGQWCEFESALPPDMTQAWQGLDPVSADSG